MPCKPIIILALESSCDETAAAVVIDGKICLANVVASQIPIQQRYGGVVPEVAARAHIEQILPVVEKALTKAFGTGDPHDHLKNKIDAIAVTAGPGLIGSLLIAVTTARGLALSFKKPLIPVNHIMGHVYSNFLEYGTSDTECRMSNVECRNSLSESPLPHSTFPIQHSSLYPFPFLTLVASGGHTDLILSRSHTDHQLISQTRDDAAGEAFDKAAALLGLPYPGGPSISKAAESGDPGAFSLPRGMQKNESLDFSFSGLKTALKQLVDQMKSDGQDIEKLTPNLAASFQQSVVDSLVNKTISASQKFHVEQINLAGGVAANKLLRATLKDAAKLTGIAFHVPDFEYCTDNAAMIGAAAYPALLENIQFPWYSVNVERQPKLSLILN